MKLQVPIKQPDGSFNDGPIGGFTYPSGKKAMIYQCGDCGQLCQFNTSYNAHKRTHDPKFVNIAFGWADGEPAWQELDIRDEGMIYNV